MLHKNISNKNKFGDTNMNDIQKKDLQELCIRYMKKTKQNELLVLEQDPKIFLEQIEAQMKNDTINFAVPFCPFIVKKNGLKDYNGFLDEAMIKAIENINTFTTLVNKITTKPVIFTLLFDASVMMDFGELIFPKISDYLKSSTQIHQVLNMLNNKNQNTQLITWDVVGQGFFKIGQTIQILSKREMEIRFINSCENIKKLNTQGFNQTLEELFREHDVKKLSDYSKKDPAVERNKIWLEQNFPEIKKTLWQDNIPMRKERAVDLFRAISDSLFNQEKCIRLSPHGKPAKEERKVGFDFFTDRKTSSREPWIGTYVEYIGSGCDLFTFNDLIVQNSENKKVFKREFHLLRTEYKEVFLREAINFFEKELKSRFPTQNRESKNFPGKDILSRLDLVLDELKNLNISKTSSTSSEFSSSNLSTPRSSISSQSSEYQDDLNRDSSPIEAQKEKEKERDTTHFQGMLKNKKVEKESLIKTPF